MNKEIIIKFKKDLYNPEILKSTAKLYKNLAKFEFSEAGDYTKVVLKNIANEVVDVIKDEYSNYALYAMSDK